MKRVETTVKMGFRLPQAVAGQLAALAAGKYMTRTQVVVELVLDAYAAANPPPTAKQVADADRWARAEAIEAERAHRRYVRDCAAHTKACKAAAKIGARSPVWFDPERGEWLSAPVHGRRCTITAYPAPPHGAAVDGWVTR